MLVVVVNLQVERSRLIVGHSLYLWVIENSNLQICLDMNNVGCSRIQHGLLFDERLT